MYDLQFASFWWFISKWETFLNESKIKLYSATVNGPQAKPSEKKRSWILTGGKKPEKWLKVSCLLTGRTNTVRLLSLSVQERITPPQVPKLRTPFSALEARRGKEEDRQEEPKRGRQGWPRGGVAPGGWTESSIDTQGGRKRGGGVEAKIWEETISWGKIISTWRKVIKTTQSWIGRNQMESYDMVLYYDIVTAPTKKVWSWDHL